ncbi:agmatine deiminase family protein [Reichenbachiella sp. MALMAid0571]|uniref:agmatine deiminase family protein n=1 Tax=Reichenbachiella sp. MALMAid0571 TaxID=3143939 RepID=UPI0032DF853D
MFFLPPEWHPQSAVQLTWPHKGTDWSYMLDEVNECFIEIAREISSRQKLLVVCKNQAEVQELLTDCNMENIVFSEQDSNDTWARDHGGITVLDNGGPVILDFGFNGWGSKFRSDKDNIITKVLCDAEIFNPEVGYKDHNDFILEGGSIESDGKGTILTTSECLLSESRNPQFSKTQIEDYLKTWLGAQRVLWLNHGYLSGDDTDSHIDTLARFCNENTIAYVKCSDSEDEHFEALSKMESELKDFKTKEGVPYKLVALPMADPLFFENERLPATYANFLIINSAVLLPFYGSKKDKEAQRILQSVFPDREVIGINCTSLTKQHGSLHCVTMQYPEGVIS